MKNKQKIIIHGDQITSTTYYCARCDAFEKQDHFYFKHQYVKESDYDRAVRVLKQYRIKMEEQIKEFGSSRFYRNKDIYNLFL